MPGLGLDQAHPQAMQASAAVVRALAQDATTATSRAADHARNSSRTGVRGGHYDVVLMIPVWRIQAVLIPNYSLRIGLKSTIFQPRGIASG